MSDEIPIGPNPCAMCGGEYGEHDKDCRSLAPASGSALCRKCEKRPATLDWVGDGGVLAWSHGMSQRWCEVCALEAQLTHAKERAAGIPEMEARLSTLKAEVPNAELSDDL